LNRHVIPHIFVEGKTEQSILVGMEYVPKEHKRKIWDCNGKINFNNNINDKLRIGLRGQSTSVLLMRDRDDIEKKEDIVKSFEIIFNNLLTNENVPPQSFHNHKSFDNVFFLNAKAQDFDLRVVLHIAAPSSFSEIKFDSDTIDGYVFALAMCDGVIQRFADNAKIAPEILRTKVLVEVPYLAKRNGIIFNQAKDMLGVYIAMSSFLKVKSSEDYATFSEIVVSRARKYANKDYQNILCSLLAALQLLEVNP